MDVLRQLLPQAVVVPEPIDVNGLEPEWWYQQRPSGVYLLHFDQRICPTHPCQHYLGYSDDINHRMAMHQRGRGARLVRVAQERGITWRLVRIWPGDQRLERHLKNRKNAPHLCPICQAEARQASVVVDTTSDIPF